MLYLMFVTGFRALELAEIRLGDPDLEGGTRRGRNHLHPMHAG